MPSLSRSLQFLLPNTPFRCCWPPLECSERVLRPGRSRVYPKQGDAVLAARLRSLPRAAPALLPQPQGRAGHTQALRDRGGRAAGPSAVFPPPPLPAASAWRSLEPSCHNVSGKWQHKGTGSPYGSAHHPASSLRPCPACGLLPAAIGEGKVETQGAEGTAAHSVCVL